MATSDHSVSNRRLTDVQMLRRATWIALGALLLSATVFLGYYFWDRYVYIGDQSPVERGIAHIEGMIRQDPQNLEARIALAEHNLTAEQYAKALEHANQVLALDPDHARALLIAGIAYSRLGNLEAAQESLQRFVTLRQDQPMAGMDAALETAYFFLGQVYLGHTQPEEAIHVLEAALAINPIDADALFQLGLAYQAGGRPDLALEQYEKAVRLVPDFVEVYREMGDSYAVLRQPAGEVYARGMEAYSLGEFQAAKAALESSIETLPDYGPAHLGLGLTYEAMGDLEAALTAVQRALELNHADLAAQQAHGRIRAALDSQR